MKTGRAALVKTTGWMCLTCRLFGLDLDTVSGKQFDRELAPFLGSTNFGEAWFPVLAELGPAIITFENSD